MPLNRPEGGHFGLILPLCTSSATVGLALFQYPVFTYFLQAKEKPSIAGKPLSNFWKPILTQGFSLSYGTAVTSAIAGFVSARWLRTHQTLETSDVSSWYTYGAVLAAGHMAFVPLIAGPIRNMINAGSEGSGKSEDDVETSNREQMKAWLTFHTVRTLVDIASLVCFAEGAALSLWVM